MARIPERKCPHCGRPAGGSTCPHCGEELTGKRVGVLKTSTILISADDADSVYRSLEDVPEPLRGKLLKSTNSLSSRTILIADRHGRQEIARALRKLTGRSRRKLASSLVSENADASHSAPRLSIAQTIGMLLAGGVGLLAWLILSRKW